MRHYICDKCKKEFALEGYESKDNKAIKKTDKDNLFIIECQNDEGWEYIDLCPNCEKELLKWLLGETE